MSVYAKDNAEFLRFAMDSMWNQTVPTDDFVLVCDGPLTEELNIVIDGMIEKHHETLHVVRLTQNGGLGNALNRGIEVCRNELIARMDADDISLPERCEKQLYRYSQKPDLCILGTQIREFIGSTYNIVSKRIVPCTYDEIKVFSRRRSPFNHPTVMFRKSTIQKLGGYPTLNRKEDLGLFILAVNTGHYCENLSDELLLYRTDKSNQKRRKTWINCKEYIQVMYGFYKMGFLDAKDMLYVLMGQLSLFMLPGFISNGLSKKYFRKT